jgi:tetratricopeptide (TPR) repeat protein
LSRCAAIKEIIMTQSNPSRASATPMRRALLTFGLLITTCAATGYAAEKPKAIVLIPRSVPGEFDYIALQKLKLNGKSEIRNAEGLGQNFVDVTKSAYGKLPKIPLESLVKLDFANGKLTGFVTSNRGFPIVPDDFDFQKANTAQRSAFAAGIMIEGEARDHTPKGKKLIPIGQIARIYIVPENTPLDEVAFRNAADSDSLDVWRVFFKAFPGSSRTNAARIEFHTTLIAAATRDFDRFKQGAYGGLQKAAQSLDEADSVLADDAGSRQLRSQLTQAEADLRATIGKGQSLLAAGDVDGAVDTLETISRYASDVTEIRDAYQRSLSESSRLHQQKGLEEMNSGRLEEARREYALALKRLPNSADAQRGQNEVTIRIGLRDAEQAVAQKNLVRALDQVKDLEKSFPSDSRISELARRVRLGRSDQLYQQALPYFTESSIDSTEVERRQLSGLKLLNEAESLTATNAVRGGIATIEKRLAAYYVAAAKKALARRDGAGLATAYLYLSRATSYDHGQTDLQGLLNDARDGFVKKATIAVAFRVRDLARGEVSFPVDLESEISRSVLNARIPGIVIIEREALSDLVTDEDVIRRLSQSGRTSVQRAAALVVAEVTANTVRSLNQPASRPSEYVADEFDNPEFLDFDRQVDRLDGQMRTCRKQLGKDHATCKDLEQQKKVVERRRDNVPQKIEVIRQYSYVERSIHIDTDVRVSYRFVDSISNARMAQDIVEHSKTVDGTEISGALPKDRNGIVDRPLNAPEPRDLLESTQDVVQERLIARILEYFRGLENGYFDRAEAAASRGDEAGAIENYALFLFGTVEKNSPEASRAKTYLSDRFNLVFDGSIR